MKLLTNSSSKKLVIDKYKHIITSSAGFSTSVPVYKIKSHVLASDFDDFSEVDSQGIFSKKVDDYYGLPFSLFGAYAFFTDASDTKKSLVSLEFNKILKRRYSNSNSSTYFLELIFNDKYQLFNPFSMDENIPIGFIVDSSDSNSENAVNARLSEFYDEDIHEFEICNTRPQNSSVLLAVNYFDRAEEIWGVEFDPDFPENFVKYYWVDDAVFHLFDTDGINWDNPAFNPAAVNVDDSYSLYVERAEILENLFKSISDGSSNYFVSWPNIERLAGNPNGFQYAHFFVPFNTDILWFFDPSTPYQDTWQSIDFSIVTGNLRTPSIQFDSVDMRTRLFPRLTCCTKITSLTLSDNIVMLSMYNDLYMDYTGVAHGTGSLFLPYLLPPFIGMANLQTITLGASFYSFFDGKVDPEILLSFLTDVYSGNFFAGCKNLRRVTISGQNPNLVWDTSNNCLLMRCSVRTTEIIKQEWDLVLAVGNDCAIPTKELDPENVNFLLVPRLALAFSTITRLNVSSAAVFDFSLGLPDYFPIVNPTIGCHDLTEITCSTDNPFYFSENNCLCRTVYYSDEDFYNDILIGCVNSNLSFTSDVSFGLLAGAFAGSNITSLHIPAQVDYIEPSCVAFCSNLAEITVSEDNQVYFADGNCLCENNRLVLGCKTSEIPDSIEEIGSSAFYGCTDLEEIYIPANVKTIELSAFVLCQNLASILLDDNILLKFYRDALVGCYRLNYSIYEHGYYLGSSSNRYLYLVDLDNYGQKSYTLHENTRAIGDWVFSYCLNLVSIDIPTNVIIIGSGAFAYCSGLISITLPSSVTSIGSYAFDGCSGLTSITIPSSVTSIGDYTFFNSGLISIEIPSSVTSIGFGAFSDCSELTSITIPSSVTSIDDVAFYGCSKLESITIPFVGDKKHEPSDKYQFPFGYIFGYSSYTGATATLQYYYGSSTSSTTSSIYYIPSSLKSVTVTGGNILYGAFYNCSGLTSINIPDSATSISSFAFYNCSGLTSFTVPGGVTSIGRNAFSGCESLISIDIPSSVTSIGSYAFEDCGGLTLITLPSSVTSIGAFALYGCDSLSDIYCQWEEGKVPGAPWGASNATVHYLTSSSVTAPTLDAEPKSGNN